MFFFFVNSNSESELYPEAISIDELDSWASKCINELGFNSILFHPEDFIYVLMVLNKELNAYFDSKLGGILDRSTLLQIKMCLMDSIRKLCCSRHFYLDSKDYYKIVHDFILPRLIINDMPFDYWAERLGLSRHNLNG